MKEDVKWIGAETDISGMYVKTICNEVSVRQGGRGNDVKLYQIESRFGGVYNITDESVITELKKRLESYEDDSVGFYEYLYGVIAEHFGIMELVFTAQQKVQKERSEGFVQGREVQQLEIQRALGLI